MKQVMNSNIARCVITGRFIAWENAVNVGFTPDSHFTEEETVFAHKDEAHKYKHLHKLMR